MKNPYTTLINEFSGYLKDFNTYRTIKLESSSGQDKYNGVPSIVVYETDKDDYNLRIFTVFPDNTLRLDIFQDLPLEIDLENLAYSFDLSDYEDLISEIKRINELIFSYYPNGIEISYNSPGNKHKKEVLKRNRIVDFFLYDKEPQAKGVRAEHLKIKEITEFGENNNA